MFGADLQIILETPTSGDADILIYDVSGKLLQTHLIQLGIGQNNTLLNIQNFSSGVYLAVVKQNSNTVSTKFIK